MEDILEIRDGCKTPLQLLKSKAFSRYLSIYKKQFIKELKSREDSEQKEEGHTQRVGRRTETTTTRRRRRRC